MKTLNRTHPLHGAGIAFLCFSVVFFCAVSTEATTLKVTPKPHAAAQRDYNLRLGNLQFDLSGSIDAAYDDNINRAEDNEEDGVEVVPKIGINAYWPLSPYVSLNSGISLGYRYYLGGDGEDGLIIGGSEGQLAASMGTDIVLGDQIFRVTEQFSRRVDTLDILARGETDDYVYNENTIGVHYRKDWTEYVSFNANYQHTNGWTDDTDFQDHASDALQLNTMWAMNRQLQIGPYFNVQTTRFDENLKNDTVTYQPGIGFTLRPTKKSSMTIQGTLGYEFLNVDTENNPAIDDEDNSVSASLTFSAPMPITDHVSHALSTSMQNTQALGSQNANYSTQKWVRYNILWAIRRNMTISANAAYGKIDESDRGENADLVQGGVNLSYSFSPNTSLDFGFNHTVKNSDEPGADYTNARITANFSYNFF